MSWNNGGPWGSSGGPSGGSGNSPGDKRPESQPKQPPNNRPGSGPEADIDAWLRRSQEKLRQALPDPKNKPSRFILVVIGVLFVLWILSGFYQVASNQLGVVLRFGEVVRQEQPGLRYHLPEPIEMVLLPDVTSTHQLKIGMHEQSTSSEQQNAASESRMLTGDENIVDIDFSVFWRVDDAEKYLFNIRDPDLTVKLASESAIREVVGRMDIQPILTEKRSSIERETAELIQKTLDEYKAGIKVTQMQLLNVSPPQPVVDAFNDVQRARADGERLRNEAEAYQNKIIPVARGDAQKLIQDAEGYREQVVSLAKGDAARFESVLKAYAGAREVTSIRLYFEAMEEVMRNANKVIIDPAVGKGGTVTPYLPLQEFIKSK